MKLVLEQETKRQHVIAHMTCIVKIVEVTFEMRKKTDRAEMINFKISLAASPKLM